MESSRSFELPTVGMGYEIFIGKSECLFTLFSEIVSKLMLQVTLTGR
jgi:hypothetical protein